MNRGALLAILFCAGAMGDSLDLAASDKQKHFAAGALVSAFSQAFIPEDATPLTRLMVGTTAALAVGIAKEFYDQSKVGRFDSNDVAATGLGGFTIGAVFMLGWLE